MLKTEVAIIGSGPAGLAAATEIAKCGIDVVVIDENNKPGGQLFKQIHKFFGSQDHHAGTRGIDIGNQLLEDCNSLGVKVMLNTVAWGLDNENSNYSVLNLRTNKNHIEQLLFEKLLIATGAKENSIAFPGWTLPGVMGAGAAQTLTNLHRVLPGKKVLMIGTGNVGLIVSYQLMQAGAEIVSIIDISNKIGGWSVHVNKLKRMKVPIQMSHVVKEVTGKQKVERALIAKISSSGEIVKGSEQDLEVDTVCLAVGLSPLNEVAWYSGCKMIYVQSLGGHLPVHNEFMQTTNPNIFVAGDICGVEEASTALEEGKLAGVSISESMGYLSKSMADNLKDKYINNLDCLRAGPLGYDRRTAKKSIIQEWYRNA